MPRTWLRFAGRRTGGAFLGNHHAAHPVNAMLNYLCCRGGRLTKTLHARGLALAIGFLHADKAGRNSLLWDTIEPRRPDIDARVFAYQEGGLCACGPLDRPPQAAQSRARCSRPLSRRRAKSSKPPTHAENDRERRAGFEADLQAGSPGTASSSDPSRKAICRGRCQSRSIS